MPLAEQVKPTPHIVAATFTRYGPFIATCIVVMCGHIPILLSDPIAFLKGLITSSIIFAMLGMMLLALIFGYILGVLPTFLTGQFFQHLIRPHLATATQKTFLYYAACAAMVWSPLLLFGLFGWMALISIAWFLFCVIVPTSLFCGWLEWRRFSRCEKTSLDT